MKYAKWLCMLLLLWQVGAVAATTAVTQKAEGYGATTQDAVADALVNAARQALGVALAVNPDFRKQSGEWVAHQSGNSTVITQKWSSAPEPRLPTLAGIESYRVTSLSQVDKTLWKASVEAKIAKSQSLRPERDKLTSVAVLPFATTKTSYDLRQPVAAATASASLRQALVDSLTQSQQVRVLDRANQPARLAEQWQSAASLTPAERAKLGHNLGADLLLTGSIDTLQLGRSSQTFYGAGNQSLSLHARLHYQLVDVATGDILAADVVNYDPPAATLRADLKAANIVATEEPERLGEVIYPTVATLLANDVLNTVAPLAVLKVVDANTIYVSGGQGRLAVGDQLAVTASTSVTNAQTGAAMQANHATGTTLEVTQVATGYAVAKVSTGVVNAISTGSQLQKQLVQPAPTAPTHPMTPGSSEAPINWN